MWFGCDLVSFYFFSVLTEICLVCCARWRACHALGGAFCFCFIVCLFLFCLSRLLRGHGFVAYPSCLRFGVFCLLSSLIFPCYDTRIGNVSGYLVPFLFNFFFFSVLYFYFLPSFAFRDFSRLMYPRGCWRADVVAVVFSTIAWRRVVFYVLPSTESRCS